MRVAPSSSPATVAISLRVRRRSARVQPVHHLTSSTVAGPKALSQRRTSSACASWLVHGLSSLPSHHLVVDPDHCVLSQPPRGRPRLNRPSTAGSRSTKEPRLTRASFLGPSATTDPRRRGGPPRHT